jgi:glycosyltransferase involved in cell wall biosynthesis
VPSSNPLVSLVLVVRNGLPHVREAVDSVRSLTYSNYELVVQDGASTDGSAEYLGGLGGIPALSFRSEPDTGIGQGFNRAFARCRGEIIGSIDSDNLLLPHTLDTVVEYFEQHPATAAVYGGCKMLSPEGALLYEWIPPAFDFLGLVDGSIVPPFSTSFFSRAHCGDDLSFDEELRTVADFDLWLRLAHLRIDRITEVLGATRTGPQSSTWNPDNYERVCYYKLHALSRYLEGARREVALKALAERGRAGIHLWAVDSMAMIAGGQELRDRHLEEAIQGDIRSDRFREIVTRARPRLAPGLVEERDKVLACGIEYLKNGRLKEALVYFRLLEDSGCSNPRLPGLLAAAGGKPVASVQARQR